MTGMVAIGEPRLAERTREVETMDDFRARVRSFLDANVPKKAVTPDDIGLSTAGAHDSSPELVARLKSYQAALHAAGLAALTWPREHGGQGLTADHQLVFNEEAAAYEVSTRIVGIGLGMVAPTILAHGTSAQRNRYLPPLLRGDEIWCQLFSEPMAGSDIAAVRTHAMIVGDHWVLNGQKVWSSVAQHAQFGLLLTRTDFDVPKHAGLSMFILPMDAAGVEVRPLRQMDGGANFNEVFLTEVRLPLDSLLGEEGAGWAAARTTLSNERFAVSGGRQGNPSSVAPLLREVRQGGRVADPVLRQELAEIYARDVILQQLHGRARTARELGRPAGPEGSVAKLVNSGLQKRVAAMRLRLLGMRAVAHPAADAMAGAVAAGFTSSPSASIAGGTDEVQRNILAERMLGLPREVPADKDLPFSVIGIGRSQSHEWSATS
jgi:alkylation response protein AidB-like acyl-CoA dehydrogenase